ncbi:DUF3108 domain-containing protein [Agrilutibacter solisilvae]|nr:DUF3108 domain-containing protein [Lysobacter solisilvae]
MNRPNKFLARTLLASVALLSGAAAAAGDITPFTAEYQANYMGMQGNGRMTLASTGGNKWRYSLDIGGSMAALNQTTVFESNGGQLRPLSNSDTSAVLIKRKQKNATYDWAKGEARWTGDVKPERAGPVKLQSGDLDAMLINLAISRDAAAGKPLRYRMVDDGRVKQLNYQVSGKETISVGGKSQEATRITRTDGDKQEVLWLVDDLPVPARILRRKDGKDEMDLRLKSLR